MIKKLKTSISAHKLWGDHSWIMNVIIHHKYIQYEYVSSYVEWMVLCIILKMQ